MIMRRRPPRLLPPPSDEEPQARGPLHRWLTRRSHLPATVRRRLAVGQPSQLGRPASPLLRSWPRRHRTSSSPAGWKVRPRSRPPMPSRPGPDGRPSRHGVEWRIVSAWCPPRRPRAGHRVPPGDPSCCEHRLHRHHADRDPRADPQHHRHLGLHHLRRCLSRRRLRSAKQLDRPTWGLPLVDRRADRGRR